jgi:16S rRNA (cytosine1402-N4)-methyltransferase
MDGASEKPSRRRRYPGKNPKAFIDKYKEQQASLYPGEIAKIIEQGKTPAGMHRPIMVDEILSTLALAPGETAVDCTLGYGGHARELLTAVQPGGRLFGVDADPIELPKTEARLRALFGSNVSIDLRRMNFAGVAQFLAAEVPEGVDGFLADLGVSSMQLDDPSRGFSFKFDGPLDMRMNPLRGLSAANFLSTLDADRLTAILDENSDEPHAVAIAQVMVKAHAKKPIDTTQALVQIVRGRMKDLSVAELDLTVRRVFQSLRIAVNDEFSSLDVLLKQLPASMKSGGRIAMLTFHSGEDRRVKASFKRGFEEGLYSSISKEVARASFDEQRSNPRSKSAKLRFAIRS